MLDSLDEDVVTLKKDEDEDNEPLKEKSRERSQFWLKKVVVYSEPFK